MKYAIILLVVLSGCGDVQSEMIKRTEANQASIRKLSVDIADAHAKIKVMQEELTQQRETFAEQVKAISTADEPKQD